ncbi:hypothetical protein [Clostridium sp. JNZ J1-5]
MNLNGTEYYYIRNAQGDIIGLYDKTRAQVVSYTYDSWGKLISSDGSLKDSVGIKNPYRYRGYRYDNETGLYYLQSCYYSPSGRAVKDRDLTNHGDPKRHPKVTHEHDWDWSVDPPKRGSAYSVPLNNIGKGVAVVGGGYYYRGGLNR